MLAIHASRPIASSSQFGIFLTRRICQTPVARPDSGRLSECRIHISQHPSRDFGLHDGQFSDRGETAVIA